LLNKFFMKKNFFMKPMSEDKIQENEISSDFLRTVSDKVAIEPGLTQLQSRR